MRLKLAVFSLVLESESLSSSTSDSDGTLATSGTQGGDDPPPDPKEPVG